MSGIEKFKEFLAAAPEIPDWFDAKNEGDNARLRKYIEAHYKNIGLL